MTLIPPSIVDRLEDAVKKRGMQNFLLHDALSKGIFHSTWSSGIGLLESWKDELRNRDDKLLAICQTIVSSVSCFSTCLYNSETVS